MEAGDSAVALKNSWCNIEVMSAVRIERTASFQVTRAIKIC